MSVMDVQLFDSFDLFASLSKRALKIAFLLNNCTYCQNNTVRTYVKLALKSNSFG